MPNSEWVPCHCSVCNKIFEDVPDLRILYCRHCGSFYAHYADITCKAMAFKEWKDNETIASIADSIPAPDGDSDDPEYIVW